MIIISKLLNIKYDNIRNISSKIFNFLLPSHIDDLQIIDLCGTYDRLNTFVINNYV